MSGIEARLAALGLAVPEPPRAIGTFVPGVVHRDILYVSGTYGTVKDASGTDVIPKPGKLGAELTVADGYESARLMLLNHLALARAVLGDLARIERPIRLVGYVNAAPGFQDAPSVLNGASDLLIEIFGRERGGHARMALYQHELARNAPIAGEISFALKD
ncbi:Enamine deaminase RidA, house cleaning of reactive enamine intermediates, YjgF/YER057c/UK114 family [Tistlia consotensis]|uniref:Enamine deaminase RidA, house cleaning of reactive enamine intermediates, YjgF/YER057c/UK114 family n=1 Tax=Tistlia consotensis USBA 355 TaxID=560819 RepID=A0A1Y6B7J7_9PROT|nr:RidA family protein [Tistlia consotensis]SME88469.1 Enamine deaminase RidA, house cleaning of reactive enamine intermediates, YjgF/YER057c/UK114 family [Tistlia consotensis USBA 355]SNR24925.1 Enamine deaminase RidA, house cleaning of reactive enamine intermediates, YjgF/YER057c/UK114 family [Tistlia consotensis]